MHAQRVIYREGTWIAVDREYNATKREKDSFTLDPQEGCNNMLLQRFRSLRDNLAEIRKYGQLPNAAAERVNTEKLGKQKWSEKIENDFPALQEVAHMGESTLYMALQGCTLALGRSAEISRQKSCWIWTLLALVGDFGTLDHERVSRIRDLGLSASRLMRRLYKNNAISARDTEEDKDPSPNVLEANTKRQTPANHNEGGSTQEYKHTSDDVSDEKQVVSDSTFLKTDNVGLGQDTVTEEAGDSDAEMVMSEDEGQFEGISGDGALEEARARLLAQLGDRLVQSQIPLPDTPPKQVSHHLSRVEAERQRQEIRRGETQHNTASSILSPKSQVLTPLSESDWNTKAAIDMILTVVAECYGQRDLLEFRAAW
jgi:hypothetical protein